MILLLAMMRLTVPHYVDASFLTVDEGDDDGGVVCCDATLTWMVMLMLIFERAGDHDDHEPVFLMIAAMTRVD